MSASTSPFVIQGTVSYPPDQGQQQVSLPFGLSNQFVSLQDSRLVMTGVGTQDVPFGSIENAKMLLVEYEAGGTASVQLHINGSTDGIEMQPDGVLLYGNPNPQAGISELSIERTADATVRVRILG